MTLRPWQGHQTASFEPFNLPSPYARLDPRPLFAALDYSLVYMLGGGGLCGAIVIFFVAKMFRK